MFLNHYSKNFKKSNSKKETFPSEAEKKQILDWLSESGLTVEEVSRLGWRVVKDQGEVKKKLGYNPKANLSFKIAIEIPYKDNSGNHATFSRFRFFPEAKIGKETAKYLGPKDQKALPYIPQETLQKKRKFKEELWITEGEKKALRLVKEGKVAIGIQGVWNFGKKKQDKKIFSIFPEIKEYLGGNRIVVLAFDSDFWKNSQVLLALYTLAFLLHKEKVKVYIAKWDERDGKGIDDFLSKNPLDRVQKAWLPESIDPQDKNEVIGAMKRAKVSDTQMFSLVSKKLGIDEKDLTNQVKGKSRTIFWEDFEEKTTKMDTDKDFSVIANFIAKVKTMFIDDEGEVTWEIELDGKKEVTLEIPGGEIVSLQRFKEALGRRGPFLYNLSSGSLHSDYLDYLMGKEQYKEVKKTQYLGRIEPDKFLFSNALATKEGIKELTDLIPPKSRIVYKRGGDLREIVENFALAYGEERVWKIFGFAVGSLFVKEISEVYGFFPLLFLYGKKGSGKSKLAELITWLFGAGREIRPLNFSSTSKSIQRICQKFCGIPITLNEYQSNPTKNNRLILSIYDREGYHRAKTDNTLETIDGEVEATCMVLSTQSPSGGESEAVLSRLIEIDMDYTKEAQKAFKRLWRERKELCQFVVHCMKEIESNSLLELIEAAVEKNEADGEITEQRIIENNSIIQACSALFFASLSLEEFIQTDIAGEIMEREKELSDTRIVKRFLTALQNLGSQEGVVKKFTLTDMTTGEYFFSLQNVYPEVRKYLRQAGLEIPDQRTLARALKDAGFKMKSKKFNGKNVKVWYISLKEITGE